MFDALVWALAHPDYPFLDLTAELLPSMKHDIATILSYLEKLREGMQPLAAGLRPPPTP